jgi:LysM repeat protein
VTPYDIYSLNPDAKNGLRPNSVLIIPKSKVVTEPKVTIIKELKGFKEHKVRRKETLYSLAKKYHIEEEDIKKHNPSLYSKNLRKGNRIQIPIFTTKEVVKEVNALTKTYTVLPKEGKWRIAYKFGITTAELEALNPNMNALLKEGEEILVPNIAASDENAIDEKYSYYKVLPKEGFYRLKLKLGLDQYELETLNPTLSESGLKAGMILKIPFSNTAGMIATSDANRQDLAKSTLDPSTKHIAILLPFKLHQVNSDSVQDAKREIKKGSFLSVSLDFYSGALMAIDSLKKLGISLKVDVFDTKNQISEVSQIVNANNFETVDAIIGPIMPKNIEKLASSVRRNIPIISPITKEVHLSDNVFQSRPSKELLKEKLVNYIKKDSSAKHIVIVSDFMNKATSNELKREFNSASQVFSRKNKEGKDAYYVVKEDLINVLKPGKNIVFLETSNEGFTSNVTSVLNSMISKEMQIILVTTDKTTAFEGDEVSNYHLSNLQFHFPTMAKQYNEDDNHAFVKAYLNQYGVTPNQMAVRGFDLTMDVVLRLASSEDFYTSIKDAPLTEYVENKFAYQKKTFGGYYNTAVYLVKYQDLKIVEVKN